MPNTSAPFDFAQGKSLSTSAQCPIYNVRLSVAKDSRRQTMI
ncbi:hypothetical protein [Nostoc sp. 'Lobaria pulmonaria (5183) cyanobiont']|nr:hypothetical protein [Nostoc sp. 'Lobaria pulmonaria (5183) cyanobiont']